MLGVLLLATSGMLVSYQLGARSSSGQPVVLSGTSEQEGPFEEVYDLAAPSVVSIYVEGGGNGSGFFYAPGKVLTNAHVVSSSSTSATSLAAGEESMVTVVLNDGRERTGVVSLVDQRLDLAIIAVADSTDVPVLAFADSGEVRPGQDVVVVGNPVGLVSSVTRGVVSAPMRVTTFRADPVQTHLVQVDAAVNPGNSGGPLLDDQGRVVGVVTIRPDDSEGREVQGVAFALPSDAVVASIRMLEEYGEARYVLLGVTGRSSTPDDQVQGMVVEEVSSGGPAQAAGLEVGDVITKVEDAEVRSYEDLTRTLLGKQPGEKLRVQAQRAGALVEILVVLVERPPGS